VGLEQKFREIVEAARRRGRPALPLRLQGVSKARVRKVLARLDLDRPDLVDAVFALLDDTHPSMFSRGPVGSRFCDGATTAHIGWHVGLLQRGAGKLDREGRDYWVKPLRELGALHPVLLDRATRTFVPGHAIAKSPNSAYRLDDEFREILKAREADWHRLLAVWSQKERVRQRAALQATLAQEARRRLDTKHADLIDASCRHYVSRFLPGFAVLYIDAGDGGRVSAEDRARLDAAGVRTSLDDAMPDVLLWNRETDALWVIEAVTSDGEVDEHKVRQVRRLAERSGKASVGFTTTYPSWRAAARRQHAHKNIAPGTYVWIQDDPSKHFLAEAFPSPA
jgi:hypothetical protein